MVSKKHRRSKQRKGNTYFKFYKNHRKESVRGVRQVSDTLRIEQERTDWENSGFIYFKQYLGVYTLSHEASGFIGVWLSLELGLQSFFSVLSAQAFQITLGNLSFGLFCLFIFCPLLDVRPGLTGVCFLVDDMDGLLFVRQRCHCLSRVDSLLIFSFLVVYTI